MAKTATKSRKIKKTKAARATKAAKNRGRPKARPNSEPAMVETELTRCTACGSTNLRKLRVVSDRGHAGYHDGKAYTRIVRRRVQCVDCSKVHIVATYAFDPKKWVGKPPTPW